MQVVRRISRRYYLRQIIACVLACLMFLGVPASVWAIGGDSVVAGSADIGYGGGPNPNVDIDVISPSAVIDWQNFDTINGQSVTFDSGATGGASFAVLNRITSGVGTNFDGILNGNNGWVMVVNPAGLVFGHNSAVTAAKFTASTLWMEAGDFMAGNYQFNAANPLEGSPFGDVTVEGSIQAENIALLGRNVTNNGTIVATSSTVILAAGDQMLLNPEGTDIVVQAISGDQQRMVTNNEKIDFQSGEGTLILAAGDIYTTAIDGIKTLRATAVDDLGNGTAEFDGPITASSGLAASPVEASVSITTGSDLIIEDNIEVEAIGNGVDDAIATIELESTGGDVTILSDDGDDLTIIKAEAKDGLNNSAKISIVADGDAEVWGPDPIEMMAEAHDAVVNNEAAINIKGDNVTIDSRNDGTVSQPVNVIASAYNGEENRAKVDIEATDGDVLIRGDDEDTGPPALVEAKAENGNSNFADVMIKANGDISILANRQGAKIHAKAQNDESPALSNEANIDIEGKNVTIKTTNAGKGNDDAVVKADAQNGEDNNSGIMITATGDEEDRGDVLVEAAGVSDDALIEANAEKGLNNKAEIVIDATGDVDILAGNDDARIKATAHHGLESPSISNEASIEITGASVTIKSQSVGSGDDESLVKAHSHNGIDNLAKIEITANSERSGDVVIESEGKSGHDTTVLALAEEGTTNEATVDIEALDDVKIISDEDDAVVAAKARNLLESDDVEDGEISGLTNIATVNLTAGDEVEIAAERVDGADALVEALAYNELHREYKDGLRAHTVEDLYNEAAINIEAERVNIDAENGAEGAYARAEAYNKLKLRPIIPEPVDVIEQIAVEADPIDPVVDIKVENLENVATVDIAAKDGKVEVKASSGGEAGVEALAYNEIDVDIKNYETDVTVNMTVEDLENTATVKIDADGEVESGIEQIDIDGDGRGDVWILAEAYNKIDFEQKSGHWQYLGRGRWRYIQGDYGATLNLDVSRLTNTAVVDISAETENVHVEAESWRSEALVEALAYNEFDVDFREPESSTGNLTFDRLTNTADIVMYSGDDVEVTAQNGAEAGISARAWNELEADGEADGEITADNIVNEATVDIDVAEDVEVAAECEGDCSEAYIEALAWNEGDITEEPGPETVLPENMTNTAMVDIIALGNVWVTGEDCGEARIEAFAAYGNDNTAEIKVDAGDTVKVKGKDGDAGILTIAEYGVDNVSEIDIDAGGSVKVIDNGRGGDNTAEIKAVAEYALNSNTAGVDVMANGNVLVLAKNCGKAGIEAMAHHASKLNDASVVIKANNVLAAAADGSEARIKARAAFIDGVEVRQATLNNNGFFGEGENNASVNIETFAVDVDPEMIEELSQYLTEELPIIENIDIDVEAILTEIFEGGHVGALALNGGDTQIEAITYGGRSISKVTNNSDVLICTEGTLGVAALDIGGDYRGTNAEIKALAHFGYENNASVGIGAPLGLAVLGLGNNAHAGITSGAVGAYSGNNADLVACTAGPLIVGSLCGGVSEISSYALDGYTNNAYTGVCADGPVLIAAAGKGSDAVVEAIAEGEEFDSLTTNAETVVVSKESTVAVLALGSDSFAGIDSYAGGAFNNDAYTGVCASEDVIVAAACDGSAYINSEATSESFKPGFALDNGVEEPYDPPTSNANTSVVSKDGSVAVLAYGESSAEIGSYADGYGINNAYTGVAAGADLPAIPQDIEVDEVITMKEVSTIPQIIENILPDGDVYVKAYGYGSDARIISVASGKGAENTADTVVCAPGVVEVYSGGDNGNSLAKIKSWAKYGSDNKATTQVYASEVKVDIETLRRGGGIGAWAHGADWLNVGTEYSLLLDGSVNETHEGEGGTSTLIIDDYSQRKDCPDCPPCPDCPCDDDDDDEPNPVPPLAREFGEPLEPFEFDQGGCPALMEWFAAEVGIPVDQINVMLGGTDYLATDIQPCEACARLKQQADAMGELDPVAVDAWASSVRTGMAGPITPEMITGIRTALADNPAAVSFDDAAAEYVRILSEELGIEADEAVALVTNNYAPDHADLGAYIDARVGM